MCKDLFDNGKRIIVRSYELTKITMVSSQHKKHWILFPVSNAFKRISVQDKAGLPPVLSYPSCLTGLGQCFHA